MPGLRHRPRRLASSDGLSRRARPLRHSGRMRHAGRRRLSRAIRIPAICAMSGYTRLSRCSRDTGLPRNTRRSRHARSTGNAGCAISRRHGASARVSALRRRRTGRADRRLCGRRPIHTDRCADGPVRTDDRHARLYARRTRCGRCSRQAPPGRLRGPVERQWRAAGVRHGMQLAREFSRRRRARHRRARGQHRAVEHAGRRRARGRTAVAEHTLLYRCNARRIAHVPSRPLVRCAPRRIARRRGQGGGRTDRASLHEGLRAHRRDRASHVAVHVDVVDVRDVGGAYHRRAVDIRDVRGTGVIGRSIDVMRSQREPCESHAAGGKRDPPGISTAAAIDPADERRRVHRTHRHRSRHPAPAGIDVRPPAIVIRRKAPGRIVDPGPSPRIDPGPVARAVRRPARRHIRRHPHRAVVRRLLPGAVIVETLVAGHVARHVAGRHGGVFPGVELPHPLVERIRARRPGGLLRQILPHECHPLALLQRHRRALPVHGGRATRHAHGRHAIGIDVEAVLAGLLRDESEVRRVDLVRLIRVIAAQAQPDRALRYVQLHILVGDGRERDTRRRSQAHRRATHAHFRAAVAIDPDGVARGQRTVSLGVAPVARAIRREGHGAVELTQTRHTPRGVGALRLREGGHARHAKHPERQPNADDAELADRGPPGNQGVHKDSEALRATRRSTVPACHLHSSVRILRRT